MKEPSKNIILIGGGGHCKSCIDVIEQQGVYNILGILDKSKVKGEKIFGYMVLGGDEDIHLYENKNCYFLITIGQIKSSSLRKKIYDFLVIKKLKLATVISPFAYVSSRSIVGEGSIVMHGVIINAGATIGSNCIINTGCILEHDVKVGESTHISTKAIVNGDCIVGNEVFIGSNSVISNQITIGDKIVIGAGTVVNKIISEQGIYVGNPVRKIR